MVVTRRGRATAVSRPVPIITAVQDENSGDNFVSSSCTGVVVTPEGAIAKPSGDSWHLQNEETDLDIATVVTPVNAGESTSSRQTNYKGTGGWEYFLNELVRPKVVSENPGITCGQVSTIASWMYKTLPPDRKQALKNHLMDGGSPSADEIFTKESPRERTVRLFRSMQFFFQENVHFQRKW
jgi:hypothetical protein